MLDVTTTLRFSIKTVFRCLYNYKPMKVKRRGSWVASLGQINLRTGWPINNHFVKCKNIKIHCAKCMCLITLLYSSFISFSKVEKKYIKQKKGSYFSVFDDFVLCVITLQLFNHFRLFLSFLSFFQFQRL